jgi:ligand-binding sensor domain-containing protein/signal transduction histidine kinase
MQDKGGNIWIGTVGGGASRFDGKSFINFTKNEGLAGNAVICIIQDKSGDIWFGTDDGATKYNGRNFSTITVAQGLPANDVLSIIQDNQGNIWFGTSRGASRYDGKSFTNYITEQTLPNNRVNSIMQDRFSNMWFGTSGGACRYDGKTFAWYTTKERLASNRVTSMLQDKSGYIWFGTYGGGASRYDGKTFSNYTMLQGLADNTVMSVMQDKAGYIWFGTFGGGISRYDGQSFSKYSAELGLAGNIMRCILQDSKGKMWIGTDAGVSSYDGHKFSTYDVTNGLPNNNVRSLMQDKAGNIWIGTGRGASRFDGRNFTNYSTDQGLPHNLVQSILQDANGNIWFATDRGGASKFDGKSFSNYSIDQGLPDVSVNCIMQDHSGKIWFGTDASGASCFDGKTFTNYSTEQGLVNNTVMCITQDSSCNIWFGTQGGGASRFDGSSFINYTTEQGLPDNVITAIAEDPNRDIIWFGTNKGLCGLKSGISGGNKFETFSIITGYPIKDVHERSLVIDKKGILWAGCGDSKVIRFDYDKLITDTTKLNLQLENIKVNNEEICWSNLVQKTDSLVLLNEMVTTFGKVLSHAQLDSMRKQYANVRFDSISGFYPIPQNLLLPYEDRNLTFNFAAIEPTMPKQVKYQYKLEGYDKDWSPMSNGTTAVFGNIPEGKYTIKLKAFNPYGALSQTEYSFQILPPWYRTWWAYGFYSFCFLVAVYIFDRIARRRLIDRERARTREKELAHAREIEKAYHELKTTQAQLIHSEKMASFGELTAGIAHEIQNPLNFVNNFSEVNNDLIDEIHGEILKGNVEGLECLAKDLRENNEKIALHGKRAEAIIKGMLQHSRTSTGQRELTDINALCDEYLRLAYHGHKAKDKNFTATLQTSLDESIGHIRVVPQDISRVLLNLYNNAFYAVTARKKFWTDGYEPTVSVSTMKSNHIIEIRVKDNGTGIQQKVIDKIFQPFFTTKPSGQGTGLGLSLSYDIIKVYGGDIKVETSEGEGTEFIIHLPID